MILTLTFRECGFMGRETAWLGDWLIGAVEPPHNGMRALWSFYPESRRRLINEPASSLVQARALVRERTEDMLRAMGVLGAREIVALAVPHGARLVVIRG